MVPVAMFASDRPLGRVAHFTASLTDAEGAPVPRAAVSIALFGNGSLEADGEHEGLPFLFQETDEDGLIYFSWRCAGEPSTLILNASTPSGATLVIKQLKAG